MSQVPPGVAAGRVAVRRCLSDLAAPELVLVACSGGPDSLALAAVTTFVAPRLGLRVGLVTVDHGLQPGSGERAEAVASWARDAGMAPVEVVAVTVGRAGGPEAAARQARYAALDHAADRYGAAVVLLGHTRDDQAETVLLALARGAGPRGLAGMAARRGRYRRPFLASPRSLSTTICTELDLPVWQDPHNCDPRFARSRLRSAMGELTELLGAGFVANLARTATLVAADTEVLDARAAELLAALPPPVGSGGTAGTDDGLDVALLAAEPTAIRTRVLHGYARRLGVSGSALASRHVDALDALVTDWHGQGPVYLPGGVTVRRVAGRLRPARGTAGSADGGAADGGTPDS